MCRQKGAQVESHCMPGFSKGRIGKENPRATVRKDDTGLASPNGKRKLVVVTFLPVRVMLLSPAT
jgi:hypothetical protein